MHNTLVPGITVQNIAQDAANTTRFAFLFLCIGSVIFMSLMFNIMYSITPALRRITLAVREISSGNFDYRLKLLQDDEMGEIANLINRTLDKVAESEAALVAEKAGVERLVLRRTKELRLEEGKFIASINGLPLGFLLVDGKGRILMINPSMKELLGLNDQDDLEVVQTAATEGSILSRIVNHSEKVIKHRKNDNLEINSNGRDYHSFFSPISISDEELGGVVILVEDVTEEKIIERSKDEFFSIASHELRTPLTAIRGNASLIEEFYKDEMKDKEFRGIVDDIHNSSIRLIGIVNDFLDASRLEQGKVVFKNQSLQLEAVIESVIKQMTIVASEKKLYVRTDSVILEDLPAVFGDPERIEQVLFNLIGNALKFVAEGGVTIKTEVVGRLIQVFVIDTGRGISLENQQLLFHKFQQANTSLLTRDTTRGTGLGLYISKLLIEEMGGSLQLVKSEEDKGSTFSFTIPIATDKDKAKTASPSEVPAPAADDAPLA